MIPLDEWRRIGVRLRGLLEAQQIVYGRDHLAASQEWVIPALLDVIDDVEAFAARHDGRISADICDVVKNGVRSIRKKLAERGMLASVPPHSQATGLIAALLTVEGEVSYLLQDFDNETRPIVERAFLHLQRLLVADDTLRAKWYEAFTKGGETACEKLGAVHLLHHGIYAFKTDAKGGRTDLVLGHRLAIDPGLRQATSALVLTEWKLAKHAEHVQHKFDEARAQAKLYGDGILAGFELRSYRYMVVVSEEAQAPPEDLIEAATIYRHINIGLSRHTPSKAARKHRP